MVIGLGNMGVISDFGESDFIRVVERMLEWSELERIWEARKGRFSVYFIVLRSFFL